MYNVNFFTCENEIYKGYVIHRDWYRFGNKVYIYDMGDIYIFENENDAKAFIDDIA